MSRYAKQSHQSNINQKGFPKEQQPKKIDQKELDRAVALVNDAIREKKKYYEKVASTDGQDPVLVEGTTTTGYDCKLLVDPKEAAEIMLDYDCPTWRVLNEDYPEGMWRDLAGRCGLESVWSIDL